MWHLLSGPCPAPGDPSYGWCRNLRRGGSLSRFFPSETLFIRSLSGVLIFSLFPQVERFFPGFMKA